ncbi:tRNA nucleotidyltransferase [Heterostelium album PN500]|uniref:tRNA nucleotidyltransferase n=1 Tax=Heterostelium pallidum (strain ATCC 26659 / Pp 5 / PN500) TaxID=670386 RepID=D3BMI6_HETP5|nr:tRNA nucleotidyltransferase [Heterostelium album PN500]EFA77198.1 tRNA nucleotidyltransferase [Heterostelium album PN500]|eukprot:XP_020429327.1 tRNA nucleotidyltransferase [Heterostelium album PN500]
MSEEDQQHNEKRMKTKHIPITLISSSNKHDNQFFHKKPHQSDATTNNTTSTTITTTTTTSDDNLDENNIVYTAIGESGETVPLNITKVEQQLFQTLLQVVEQTKCGTVLRVAGGWVRDKLRGDHSSDIDIALDNMMGEAFASLVNQYLKDHKQETHRIGVIQSNPAQSKHLETATVRIYDMWIDFVNLRSETYSDHSRIPEITIGTPEQDAYRRDLTINSLFYNINENKIEDFTGNGVDDLKCGIVRTPLPPQTTFLDDPLRVLRSIRFATRLYYAIDHKLVEAASSSTVKDALASKVSHERVGIELDGMLSGPRPDLAIHLINHFGLFDHIFSLPEGVTIKEKNYQYIAAENILNMMRFISWGSTTEELPTRKIRLLSSLLQVFHNYTFTTKKNRTIPAIQYTIVEFLKFSNKDYDDVLNVLECADRFKPEVQKLNDNGSFSRKDVGLIVYKAGPLWRVALANALISELPKYNRSIVYPFQRLENPDGSPVPRSPMHDFHLHSHNPHVHHPPLCEDAKKIVSKYDNFCASVASHNLVGIWNTKKLLDGKQVMELLKKKPGAWLAPVLQEVFEWQLENPNSNEEQCKQWVLNKFS